MQYLWTILQILKTPLGGEVNDWWWHAAHNHEDPREAGPEDWWYWLLLTSTPAHQKNVHELITPSLKKYYQTSLLSSPHWDTWFWGHYLAVAPFFWQSNNVIFSYFTQNSVSKIQFGTDVERSWVFRIKRKRDCIIFKAMMPETFPTLNKKIHLNAQHAQWTLKYDQCKEIHIKIHHCRKAKRQKQKSWK